MKEQTKTRDYADTLGVKYHHNANDNTVQKAIDSHFETHDPIDPNVMAPGVLPKEDCIPMTTEEFTKKYKTGNVDKRKECSRLIRVRIQCMNPTKKDWPGEIVSVGSARLGTWKKYIPFNSPEPYHVPKIIFDMLVDKKCTIFHTEKDQRGNAVRKGRLVNEYALEVLDPLTPSELEELARTQALQTFDL